MFSSAKIHFFFETTNFHNEKLKIKSEKMKYITEPCVFSCFSVFFDV